MKYVLSSVAAAALAAGLAAPAAAEPFNGPFVGAQVGWSQHDAGTPTTPLGELPIDRTKDGVSGGVYAGYDAKLGSNFVLGAEAGVQFSKNNELAASTDVARFTLDPKRSIDLTARAGYLAGDNTLLYARGGYTNARISTGVEDAAGLTRVSENRDGWLVGGGVEHAFTDNLSARAEYRYSDLSEGDQKFDRHQALFGFSYRF